MSSNAFNRISWKDPEPQPFVRPAFRDTDAPCPKGYRRVRLPSLSDDLDELGLGIVHRREDGDLPKHVRRAVMSE